MTDIVDRLRGPAPSIPAMRDAADEIERLHGIATHETLCGKAAAEEVERLRAALRWNAAALNECCKDSIRESSHITINSDTKTFGEILDMADAVLGRAALQGEPHE